jgi:hypothetical protein
MTIAAALVAAAVATTLELLPERIDLPGFVLQSAGLVSLLALAAAVGLGEDVDRWATAGTVIGAGTGLGLFSILLFAQEIF